VFPVWRGYCSSQFRRPASRMNFRVEKVGL
jgi:hypothetical protein